MADIQPQTVQELTAAYAEAPIADVLQALATRFAGQVCFSTSFSWEDQAITDHIARSEAAIRLFTLDTGRLFPETYSTWSTTLSRYGLQIDTYYPDADELRAFVSARGPNAFYASVEDRKTCCDIRKVNPLRKALAGQRIWITGLRAEHSPFRQQLQHFEWDAANQLVKYHPLLHWTTEELKNYIQTHNVPYNPLHDRGFVSIGCAPCTRAVREGEDFRAGRWWWEQGSRKECGLHASAAPVVHTS